LASHTFVETLHLLNLQYEFPSHLKTNQLVSSRALFAQVLQQLQSSKPVNVNYHYESNWEGSLAPKHNHNQWLCFVMELQKTKPTFNFS